MKGKKCIGLLILFTIFLPFLNLYSDASALELTTEVEATGNTFEITDLYCRYADGTSVTRSLNCRNPVNGSNIVRLRPTQKIHTEEGYYYRTFLSIKTNGEVPEILYRIDTDYDNWSIVAFNEVTSDQIIKELDLYCYNNQNQNSGCGNNANHLAGGIGDSYYAKFWEVTLKAKHTGDYYYSIGDNTNFFVNSHNTTDPYVYVGIVAIEEFRATGAAAMNDKDDEDRENIESQSSEAQGDADDSGDEAESTGTTLLSAFSAFVTALTNASPSNCSIDMDLGNLDLGNVDLCDLDPPAGFSTLASIFMIMFCVPLSIATARKVISLFRSFQT